MYSNRGTRLIRNAFIIIIIISCQCHNGDGPRLLPFLKTAPEGLIYKAVSYGYGSSECGRLPFKGKNLKIIIFKASR